MTVVYICLDKMYVRLYRSVVDKRVINGTDSTLLLSEAQGP